MYHLESDVISRVTKARVDEAMFRACDVLAQDSLQFGEAGT